MLETVDLKTSLANGRYKELREQLRIGLSQAQHRAWDAGLGVIVVLEGWNFSGKAHCMRFLSEPLDPRGMQVHMMYPPTKQERRYPFERRYALRMPSRGRIGLFVRSWYYHVLDERIMMGDDALVGQVALEEIRLFEQALADDGYLILKFWLHISRKEQLKRRKEMREGALRRYRTGPDDPRQHRHWEEYTQAVEEMFAATSTEFARWHAVPATDFRTCQVTVASTLIQAIDDTLRRRKQAAAATPPVGNEEEVNSDAASSGPLYVPTTTILGSVNLAQKIDSSREYEQRLTRAQHTLNDLQYACLDGRRPVIFCFEGWDAAGKGGIIGRLTSELDPRYFHVIPVSAPRGDEADHQYLWRFWRNIPEAGQWTIFDRTWYGRVLVERVEGFAKYEEWQRAYREIRHFEQTLTRNGAILLKFWLHISPEEQLRRFQERETVEYKTYKITDEDWRNRDRWSEYQQAVEEMLRRTSTPYAPWRVVPANDKQYARINVLETAVSEITRALQQKGSSLLRRFRRNKKS